MSSEHTAVARVLVDFATELTRAPLYECGHADAWDQVRRALTTDGLLVALGYCAGYADCARIACPWNSPAWRIADTLSTAARTFAALVRGSIAVDPRAQVATYRAELAHLLERAASEPRPVP